MAGKKPRPTRAERWAAIRELEARGAKIERHKALFGAPASLSVRWPITEIDRTSNPYGHVRAVMACGHDMWFKNTERAAQPGGLTIGQSCLCHECTRIANGDEED